MKTSVVKLVKNTIRLFPVPLAILFLFWSGVGIFLTGLLFGSDVQKIGTPPDKEHLANVRPPGDTVIKQLRLYMEGRGRARNWKPEELREFHLIQEIEYSSTVVSSKNGVVIEKRVLERLRFLLLSSPLEPQPTISWGVTNILSDLREKASVVQYGRGGLPISPPEPTEMSGEMIRSLSDYFRGPDAEQEGGKYRMMAYISPSEGESVMLRHDPFGEDESKFVNDPQVSDFEKKILLASPFLPGLQLLRNQYTSESGPSERVILSGKQIRPYLYPFFRIRSAGTLSLQKVKLESGSRYRGSGEFNLLSPSENNQIGDLVVDGANIDCTGNTTSIRQADLQGNAVLFSMPTGHLLNYVRFLERPQFELQYRVRTPE